MLNVSRKKTLTFLLLTLFSVSIVAANPKKKRDASPPRCCANKERCCEDERKPHNRKPHLSRVDWRVKKAALLKRFDKDGDGKISPEEKKSMIEEWKKHNAGKSHGRKSTYGRHKPQRGKNPHRGQ